MKVMEAKVTGVCQVLRRQATPLEKGMVSYSTLTKRTFLKLSKQLRRRATSQQAKIAILTLNK